MRGLGRAAALACVALSVAACLGGTRAPPAPGTDSPTPVGTAADESFDGPGLPAGWVAHKGTWRIRADGAGRGQVLEGRGDADPGLSSLVDHGAGAFANFTLDVEFAMRSGEHPQGAGAVFDWRDDRNYLIVRYSLSEQGWHLFTVVDGARDKQGAATVPNGTSPQFGDWVRLRVVQQEGVVRALDGNTTVLEYRLAPADSRSGLVGAFVRGDTVADFDGFRVRAT